MYSKKLQLHIEFLAAELQASGQCMDHGVCLWSVVRKGWTLQEKWMFLQDASGCFLHGTSQLNQGFESWWGILRLCIQFWISLFYELLIRLCFTNFFQVGIISKQMFGIVLIFSYAILQKLYIACTTFYRETAFLGWSLIDVNPTAFNAVWDVSRTYICILWMRQFRMEIVKSVLRWIKR